MKKLIAAAGIGAALAIAPLAVAGTASASSGTFINELNAHGWHDSYTGSLLNLGYRACGFINSGYSWSSVVNDVYYRTDAGTSWGSANEFVSLANNYLC